MHVYRLVQYWVLASPPLYFGILRTLHNSSLNFICYPDKLYKILIKILPRYERNITNYLLKVTILPKKSCLLLKEKNRRNKLPIVLFIYRVCKIAIETEKTQRLYLAKIYYFILLITYIRTSWRKHNFEINSFDMIRTF